jgi:hypothetical protein
MMLKMKYGINYPLSDYTLIHFDVAKTEMLGLVDLLDFCHYLTNWNMIAVYIKPKPNISQNAFIISPC